MQKLRRSNVLKAINDAINSKGINLRTIGMAEIRHFLYKSKSNAQLLCSEITVPYNTAEEFYRLESLYYDVHHRIHNSSRPLKLIYELHEKEIILAWVSQLYCLRIDHCRALSMSKSPNEKQKSIFASQVTTGYELYVTFEPTVDKNLVITLVNKLLSWIKKEEELLFILNAPTF